MPRKKESATVKEVRPNFSLWVDFDSDGEYTFDSYWTTRAAAEKEAKKLRMQGLPTKVIEEHPKPTANEPEPDDGEVIRVLDIPDKHVVSYIASVGNEMIDAIKSNMDMIEVLDTEGNVRTFGNRREYVRYIKYNGQNITFMISIA